MVRYLPFTGVEENATDLTNTQSEITGALDHNPIANLTQEMRKKCPDEQIYYNPTQNLTLERIRR